MKLLGQIFVIFTYFTFTNFDTYSGITRELHLCKASSHFPNCSMDITFICNSSEPYLNPFKLMSKVISQPEVFILHVHIELRGQARGCMYIGAWPHVPF
jgi:hypothetical protein